MNLERIIFAVLFLASLTFFFRSVYRLLALLCLGKWENRFDNLSERFIHMLAFGFAQLRVIRTTYGFNHLLIFWGFMTLLAANGEFLLKGLFPDFSLEFIGSAPYAGLMAATEIMSLLVIAAVGLAVARRTFFRPPYIEATLDAYTILAMIGGLMIAYFGFHAGEIRLGETSWADSMPISQALAAAMASMSDASAHLVTRAFWWIHALVLLAFMNYLPYSKHLHVMTAIPNIFFRSFDTITTVPRVTFKRGNSLGISKITQFKWKDLLDFMACTECGRCQESCPVQVTGKHYNPREMVHVGKMNLFKNGDSILKSRPFDTLAAAPECAEMPVALVAEHGGEATVSERDLWSCTTCGACMANCPVFIEHAPKVIEMRRSLVMEHSRFPEELLNFFQNMEQRANPWGLAPSDRTKWAQDLDVKVVTEDQPVEYLFFVGCSGAYDSRNRSVVHSITKILNAAGLNWGILGNAEKCCGDSLRRLGNEFVFEQLVKDNIAQFNKMGVKKIVTHCPHCFSTLKNDYKQFGADFEIIHHSQLIDQLIAENKLDLKKKVNGRTVFHDSCYLGRLNGIYDEPRNILESVSGGTAPLEMNRCEGGSFCCGAGGGRMWLEETEGKRIYMERTNEALALKPSTIAVACPFCMTMFEDGVKEAKVDAQVRVRDLAEIVSEALD